MSTMALPTGKEIRQARLDRGLTLKELASAAQVHYLTVQRYEMGTLNVHPRTIRKVVEALKKISRISLDDPPARV